VRDVDQDTPGTPTEGGRRRLGAQMKQRILILAVLTLATAGIAAAPHPLSSPIAKLANYHADSGDPIYDTTIDASALRRAATLLPDRTTYLIWDDPSNAQLDENLHGATGLLFTPALPVADSARASWVLSYDAPTLLPKGLRPARVITLDPGIALVRVG
jgi:hypothetical protein